MRVASLLGLLVSLVAGFLVLAQMDVLQDSGEGLSGSLGTFYESLSGIVLILMAAIGVFGILGMVAWIFRR